MFRLLAQWILNAVSLLIVTHFVPGFRVANFTSALIAALVISLVNVMIGIPLKILTFPFTVVTLGIFVFVINALLLKLASNFVSGFTVTGFLPAFIAAILLAILHAIWRAWLDDSKRKEDR